MAGSLCSFWKSEPFIRKSITDLFPVSLRKAVIFYLMVGPKGRSFFVQKSSVQSDLHHVTRKTPNILVTICNYY